jgi:hypothetical protein
MDIFQRYLRRTWSIGYLLMALFPTSYSAAQSQNVARQQPRSEDSVQGQFLGKALKENIRRSSPAPTPEVRLVYLVPSDINPRRNFRRSASDAIRSLQRWYGVQVGGKTFGLHTPVVETVRTAHSAKWYAKNQSGEDRTLWFWNNATADGFEKTGGAFDDPRFIWVFYIDADPDNDQRIGGGSGVAVLARHDALGILGLGQESVCRWVGGLGHELGHAFGLDHPASCENGQLGPSAPECQSLMFLGYLNYCGTLLTPEHRAQLEQSPFFSQQEIKVPHRDCSD